MNRMNEYEEAIRTAVCTECIHPSGTGLCGTGQWKDCPLNKFLPQAIDAVNAGRSASLIDYFMELLEATLHNESELPEGSRMPAEDVAWFERFLPLIAEVVGELKDRPSHAHRPVH